VPITGEKPLKPTFHLTQPVINFAGRRARLADAEQRVFSQRFERLGQLITRLTALKLPARYYPSIAAASPQDVFRRRYGISLRRVTYPILPITREYPSRFRKLDG